MALSTWLAFFAASWVISFSPGPGAISSMSSGLKYGFKRGYWMAIGLNIGIMIQVFIISLGLGQVLARSELAFTTLKWLGAAYLIYLGWKQLRTDAMPVQVTGQAPSDFRIRDLLLRGCLINITNPKGLVFLLAIMPQFLDVNRPMPLQYLLIALTLCFTDLVAMGCYTSLAARMLHVLRQASHVRLLNRVFGSLFILAGTVLASVSR
ncbi:LysE family transporter [Alcaligenes ammonioxydans]|jgi:homoserine/homoserine lactone efflux protein|uniref:LysE family transporter n=1 Tax=Alcaligenes ammonioxydans TaxID=2582914 RepID=A0ABX8SQN8_9BURK|nr:LysE family transporter [Alcaligenes ammonioxydans]MBX7021399.1 threonine transporter RhtB [Providencia rettgeri]WGQ35732.1 LysE family transporter [Alcaligenes faecalis]MCH1880111.1 LysE family transporter [Alcaligenes ammonioxydans]QXX77690.1 LysE family transporter [Alcaligenes ammonioxydans]HRK85616.1 LysE family transporter [Alcaligenes faecalis]